MSPKTLKPKYLALKGAVTGLPWTTVSVRTIKCDCNEHNYSLLRRCTECSRKFCNVCFSRPGGFKHPLCPREYNRTGPFPSFDQEKEILRRHGCDIPPRHDAQIPESAAHDGTWVVGGHLPPPKPGAASAVVPGANQPQNRDSPPSVGQGTSRFPKTEKSKSMASETPKRCRGNSASTNEEDGHYAAKKRKATTSESNPSRKKQKLNGGVAHMPSTPVVDQPNSNFQSSEHANTVSQLHIVFPTFD